MTSTESTAPDSWAGRQTEHYDEFEFDADVDGSCPARLPGRARPDPCARHAGHRGRHVALGLDIIRAAWPGTHAPVPADLGEPTTESTAPDLWEKQVAFLAARLAEDEIAARAATSGPWRHDPEKEWRDPQRPFTHREEAVFAGPLGADATTVCLTGESGDRQSMRDARHIALWDPDRVLTEIAAKRKILADSLYRIGAYDVILQLLLEPYANRPGFNPGWLTLREKND